MAVSVRTELNRRVHPDGTRMVSIRYTVQRQPKREGTIVRIAPKDYNPKGSFAKANWVRASCRHHLQYNKKILDRMKVIYGVAERLEQTGAVTADRIQQELIRIDGGAHVALPQTAPCFLIFFQAEIDRMRQNSPRHADNFQATLNKLREFVGSQSLPIGRVTLKLVKDYYAWECQRNKISTVNKSISRMWGIYNEATKEGIVEQANPFGLISRKKPGKVMRRRLDFSEIRKLADLALSADSRPRHIRDIFLLQFYVHGMRIGDAISLRVGDLHRTADGGLNMTYTTEKTEAGLVGIELVAQARALIEPYLAGKESRQFVFPFLKDGVDYSDKYFLECQIEAKTAYINRVIKQLARQAGIDSPGEVSTHVARHSFADLARRSGASVYDISKGLRHGSIRITEMYLSSLDEDAVNSLNDVYGKADETTTKQF